MVNRFTISAFAACVACGGHTASASDAAAGDELGHDAGQGDEEPVLVADSSAPEVDAMTFDAHVYDDAGPPTCADVGRYPSIATCCNGAYCAGACWNAPDGGHNCICAVQHGGCTWPLVCCLDPDGCVGASVCKRW